jgi:hypothetical protein
MEKYRYCECGYHPGLLSYSYYFAYIPLQPVPRPIVNLVGGLFWILSDQSEGIKVVFENKMLYCQKIKSCCYGNHIRNTSFRTGHVTDVLSGHVTNVTSGHVTSGASGLLFPSSLY